MSKKTNVQIIRTRTACNSKIQTTAFWQRPVGPPVAPSITSVAMGLLGTATLTIAAPKTDGGSRVTSYIVTSSPGQVTTTFKPDQIKAAKISSLIPGNTYSFSVIAINSKGSSLTSFSSKPALAPIPIPIPVPAPVPRPVPVPIQISEPEPTPTPTPTPTTISTPAIAGVAAPVTGATPVTATTAGTGYTGTVTWSGTPRFFASITSYTATITLTATSGYTLSGISANFFTVAGASSVTHSANSGVITAVFPATSLSVPVFTLTSSIETRTVNSVATGFTINSTGDAIASFSITPPAPAGMSFNTTTGEFTGTPTSTADVTNYTITATNLIGSATRTFTFTVTAPIVISDAPIGGIAAPVTGADPARTTTAGTGYTGTISWSPSAKLFAPVTVYTATITLTPTSGYTLTGVGANFFTVAGATSVSHDANSGVITAEFPATAKLSQTITFDTPSAMTVGGSTQTVSPTASSSLTVTLTSTTTGICTVSGFVITAVGSGTCSITASQAGNTNYEAATQVVQTFASKATQTITFIDPADITYGQSPSSLSATSTSSLTVAFTTATSGICTVSGTTLTILSSGTCTINANQAGDASYEAATQVAQSFTIAKATPSLSNFADLSKTVGDASFTLSPPTVANSLPGSFTYTSATTATATISGTTITLGSAGTTVITATFTPTDTANYNSATMTMTLTLSVAAPAFTLSSSSETRTVNTAATGFTINSTGGAIASFEISATPAGMSFNTSTGALTGTPTTVASATSYTVTATNATGSTTQTFTLTVSRATQATLSITTLTTSTKAYPYSQALSITTSGGSGSGTTTFAIASGGSASGCALSNSTATATITATTVGTCLIQATKAADSTYDEITSAAATFIFDKASQSITFTTPSPMTFGGSNQSITPTASSSLTVTLTSTTTGICTVAGFVITAVGSGTCSITASQAGNSNYLAAFNVVRTFGILKATQSISFTTPSAMTVGESNQSVTPTASSSLTVTLTSTTTGICTVVGFVITAVAPGTCSITSSQAGNENYETAANVTRSFVITGVINVAAIAGITAPVIGAIPVDTVTATSQYTGNVYWEPSAGTFAAATVYTARITLTPKSGYTLTGVSANFFTITGATSVTHLANSGVITAEFPATAKLSQSITFTDPADISYGISPSSLSATSTSGLTVAFTTATSGICSVSGTTVTVLTAGTCTINASQAGNANYEAASQVSQSFTIAKASQSITFTDPADITYGQSPSSLSATSTSTLTVVFTSATSGVCTVTGTTLTLLTAGTCTINVNQAGDTNYEAASQVSQAFTIAKATPSLSSFNHAFRTKDVPTFTLTAPTVTNSLPGSFSYTSATTATATISGATVTLGNVGTTVITATFTPTDTTNYNNSSIQMTLTVSTAIQATLSITSLTTDTKTYSYLSNLQALSITTSGGSGTGAITFAIALGGSATGCALSNATATATVSAISAGTCWIRATKAADSTYDARSSETVTFTFTKATPTLSNFPNLSKTIGDAAFDLTLPTSAPPIEGSFTFSSATTATATISSQRRVTLGSAGTTVITATFTPTNTTNYNSATIQMTLTVSRITQATLSITTLTTSTKAYPDSQALSISTSGGSGSGATTFAIASGGSASGCTLSNSTSTATVSAASAGTCWIRATKAADSTYEATASAAATFTFTKATQSITFTDPADITYGTSPSTLSATSTSTLTVAFTTATSGVCTVSGTTVTVVSVGTCTINANQAGNANYEAASQVVQSFAISKASQTVTFTAPANITYGDTPASLSATSTSGLTVAFTTATSGVCTVSGTTVTIVSVGICTINANQAGNVNFEPASQVAQSFTIAKATPNLSNFANLSKTTANAPFTLSPPTVANSLTGSFTYTSATTATATISGATVTLGSAGTTVITATFTPTDTANYNSATITMTLTVSTATCAEGGVCAVGDRGPGGGYVFYVSATNFTSTGSTCNTSCKYLEVAPVLWMAGFRVNDDSYPWGSPAWIVAQNYGASTEGFADDERVNWQIGQGFYNTSFMSGTTAAAVRAYAGNAAAGEWFIPSMNELNELCKYVWGQTTGDLKVQCSRGSSVNFKSPDGFVQDFYWSSTQYTFTGNLAWMQDFKQGNRFYESKENSSRVRPIRAFGP
jgi:hypothetical protein